MSRPAQEIHQPYLFASHRPPPPLNPADVRYTFIDLFAGIGGFRFGFEPTGGACVWSCEINPHARRTYSLNHRVRESDIFPDIRYANAITDVPDHDVLIAGFPCQPFSKAGVSKSNSMNRPHGFADETRGTLFFEIIRILAEHRPAAFLLENVPNLLKHDQGRTFATIRYLLAEELGYHISHRVIDARPWVPQKRRRVFIAGHRLPNSPTLDDIKLPSTIGAPNLADIIHPEDGTEPAEHPYTSGADAAVSQKYTLGQKTWEALTRHRSRHESAGNGFGYTLAALDQPARALTARYAKDGQEILISQPDQLPRRLTPRECSRLMGMPDLIIPNSVSDTQAYRQLGNSVVPALVTTIASYLTA